MLIADQKYRTIIGLAYAGKEDSLAADLNVPKVELLSYLWTKQSFLDSVNMSKLTIILCKHGYPGKSLVGDKTNEVAFYILQHSDQIEKYLSLVKEAAEKMELPFYLFAMMLDRHLMQTEKEQEYGTQITGFDVVDPVTKKTNRVWVIWPVRDANNVNERRIKAGFTYSIEEYAKSKGFIYKSLTLDELRNMQ
nr:DUF6624 domain-containing protein [uncultured Lacibacter sp.]